MEGISNLKERNARANNMKELTNLRKRIDEVDEKIKELLEKRLKFCERIGKIKRKYNLRISDKKREIEVLKKAGKFKSVFKEIIKICKKVQYES